MYETDTSGYFGHSNDSLFASADEMAGNYSPHYTDTTRSTPTQHTPPQPVSHRSNDNHPPDDDDVELDYPMPDEPEIWRQAEHPDSINKFLNVTGDVCMETFRGAAKMLSHANPDTFDMPLEARFICMKVDRDADMRYCLSTGTVTNLAKCNERINKVWYERNGQRVFMMFSISGQKEFCAMAEMLGPVSRGSMPGWSKPDCEGLIFLTFIFVKNVPFALINHIKHKSNRQPVANMWNSMMYHDNTGYHVARIYCEHPVLSSVLVKIHTEQQSNYKTQLRIPTSGNTTYSASSYSSSNDKSHDPRSATKVAIYRSGNRGNRNNIGRYGSHNGWWRHNDAPPTPTRQTDGFVHAKAKPTPIAPHSRGIIQPNMNKSVQPPPQFKLSDGSGSSVSGSDHTPRSFTTADDRMLAKFANSRDAKRSEVNQTPSKFPQVEAPVHDPFHVGRALHDGQHHTTLPINANWQGMNYDASNGRHQSSHYDVQWQGDGRAAQVPVFFDISSAGPPSAGLGITSGAREPYNRQSQQPVHNSAKVSHLPSPDTSSQSSNQDLSPQFKGVRRQQSQGFALASPRNFNAVRSTRGHGHPVPQLRTNALQGTVAPHGDQKHVAKSGSPIKHSQSMPVMQSLTQRLSAQHLHAHNTHAKTNHATAADAKSPSIQDWVVTTPTRVTTVVSNEISPNMALTLETPTNLEKSPEMSVRSADMADRLKWHKAMAVALEVEVRIAQANGQPTIEKEEQIKWHNAKAVCLEVEITAAHRRNKDARGDLAQGTANHLPASPSSPHNSADWPSRVNSSTIESAFITPESNEYGKILRSVSKKREGKATHIGQQLRHRRGDIGNGGFTSSFDARASANVENLVSSPALAGAYPAYPMAYTHGHPKQDTSVRTARAQHDSCTEDQHCNGDERYIYREVDDTFDFASQVGPVEEDDQVFSPRGRSYHHSHPTRNVSQISHNGGIELEDGHEHK